MDPYKLYPYVTPDYCKPRPGQRIPDWQKDLLGKQTPTLNAVDSPDQRRDREDSEDTMPAPSCAGPKQASDSDIAELLSRIEALEARLEKQEFKTSSNRINTENQLVGLQDGQRQENGRCADDRYEMGLKIEKLEVEVEELKKGLEEAKKENGELKSSDQADAVALLA